VLPTSEGTFGFGASRFGFELYKEVRAAISFARALSDDLKGGITVNYYNLSIQNYGSASTFGIDVGLLVDIVDNVQWGFVALNVNAPAIGAAKEKLPQVFATGVAYTPFKGAGVYTSVSKDLRYPVEVQVGVEYEFVEMIAIRAGTSSEPSTLNAGMGIHYSFARLDYAFTSHTELGITHQFSLSLNVGDL
jgi:hypothetical protein